MCRNLVARHLLDTDTGLIIDKRVYNNTNETDMHHQTEAIFIGTYPSINAQIYAYEKRE